MDRGDLVPDDVMIEMIRLRTSEPDCAQGFILDGFPRTVPQAEALDRMLAERGLALDFVIEIDVDEAALIDRLSGRFTCKGCGASYHDRYRRPQAEGVCDGCGGREFLRRPDDQPEAIRTRFAVYHRQTAPILPYYERKGLLRRVDGNRDIDAVTEAIERILG
jgi:adenylate kinase